MAAYGLPNALRMTVGSDEANERDDRGACAISCRDGRLMAEPIFPRLALIGIGLIGSSIALAARQAGLAGHDRHAQPQPRRRSKRAERAGPRRQLSTPTPPKPRATPIWSSSACRSAPRARSPTAIAPALKPGAIVSDVGSVKAVGDRADGAAPAAGRAFRPRPSGRRHRAFRPGRRLRRALPEPLVHPDAAARHRPRRGRAGSAEFWRALGANVEMMSAGAPRPGARHHQPPAPPDRLQHRRHRRRPGGGHPARR